LRFIFTHLYFVSSVSNTSKVTQCSLSFISVSNITSSSVKLVVKSALAIVAVAFGSTNSPLGFHQSSVSILKVKSSHKSSTFANASFRPLPSTPLHITGILTLVLPATSPIFCSVEASANVGHTSLNRLSHLLQGSQSIKVSSVKLASFASISVVVNSFTFFGVIATVSLLQANASASVAILIIPFAVSVACGGGVQTSKVSRC
jgi:hypothetical protein